MSNEKALARTAADAMGYGQVVPMTHQILPHAELVSRELTAVLDPDVHFYAIESFEDGQRKVIYRPLLEGKLIIEALAGAWHETQIDENTASRSYVRAIATVYYRTPTGEVREFTRDREYDVELEYNKAVLKRVRSALYNLKKSGNALYEQITRIFAEAENPEQAIQDLIHRVLTPEDVLQLRLTQMEIRTNLRALCRSKALSQALTEFCRFIGTRLSYSQLPSQQIEVKVINTIEIPRSDGIEMIYGEDEEADERETEAILRNAEGEEAVGQALDDNLHDSHAPTREELISRIEAEASRLGWTAARLRLNMMHSVGKSEYEQASDQELGDFLAILEDLHEDRGV